MYPFAKCEINECEKKEDCVRFSQATSSVINYKPICMNNNYQWYMETKKEVVVSEDKFNASTGETKGEEIKEEGKEETPQTTETETET